MFRTHTLAVLALSAVLATFACAEHDAAGPPTGSTATSTPTRIADYQTARGVFWGTLYAEGGETLYCAKRFGARAGRGINIEHVFPMSWVTRHLRCGQREDCRKHNETFNRVEADLHNLWPALTDVNKARRSYPFAMIDGEKHLRRDCDFEVDERRRFAEPRAQARGEIARSMFYMANEYGLQIRARLGALLQRWNREDPVSAEERRRNDVIESLQGNRNPYIDNPQLADALRF